MKNEIHKFKVGDKIIYKPRHADRDFMQISGTKGVILGVGDFNYTVRVEDNRAPMNPFTTKHHNCVSANKQLEFNFM